MRFLVDECAGPKLAEWLVSQGHDVFSVFDQRRGASDDEIAKQALQESRILITLDRDFSYKVFRERILHCGMVFLRLHDERAANKIRVMQDLLSRHADRLENAFVVATDSVVRFAQKPLPPPTQ